MITADQRGFGVGPALVRQLQADHPDTEIDFGLLTDDGARMLAKLPTTFTPNPDYVAKHERYAQLKAQDAEWMALSDKLYQTHQIEAYRTMGREIGDRWNALHDEVSELEHELGGLKPGKRLIVI
jgi:hypothetical protein